MIFVMTGAINLNKIKVTRYEFDGTGIFHAIDLLESCQMGKKDVNLLEETVKTFNQKLPLPSIFKDNKKIHFMSFFTEYALVDFAILLKNLSDLFIKYCETAGFGEINKTVYYIPKNMIEYQDNYQILISEDNYSHLTPNSI